MATDSGTPDAKFLVKKDDASDLWRKNPNQRVSILERSSKFLQVQEKPNDPLKQPPDGKKSKLLPHRTTSKISGAESKTVVPPQVETTQSNTLPRPSPRVRQILQPAPNQESKDLEINPRQQVNNKKRWSCTEPAEATQSSTRSQASSHVQKMPQPRQQPSKNNRWSVSIPVETPISSTLPQTSPQTPQPTPTPVVSKPPAEAQLNTTQTPIDGKHPTTESLEVCTIKHVFLQVATCRNRDIARTCNTKYSISYSVVMNNKAFTHTATVLGCHILCVYHILCVPYIVCTKRSSLWYTQGSNSCYINSPLTMGLHGSLATMSFMQH